MPRSQTKKIPISRSTLALAVFLIAAGALLRVVRHFGLLPLPPNVAPVSAMAMFSAVYLPRRYSLIVPLALMVLSDALIGFYTVGVMASVYGSFLISAGIGFWLRRRVSTWRVVGASLAGSVFFFLVTNAAVWAFDRLYPPTAAGLLSAYLAGLPFFRNTALGDLGYSGLFFGLYQAVVLYWKSRQSDVSPETNG